MKNEPYYFVNDGLNIFSASLEEFSKKTTIRNFVAAAFRGNPTEGQVTYCQIRALPLDSFIPDPTVFPTTLRGNTASYHSPSPHVLYYALQIVTSGPILILPTSDIFPPNSVTIP